MTKHTKNENYFGQKSLQSIYWAGFIAARGYIYPTSPNFSLQVKECKEERLYKFLEHVELKNKKVYTYCDKNNTIRKRLSITSHQWKEDLEIIYNFPANRTKEYIPNITKDIEVQSYLLGYLDVGAYISYSKETQTNSIFTISIWGNIDFLNWIKTYIDKWGEGSAISSAPISNKKSKSCSYSIHGKKAVTLYSLLSNLPIDKSDTWGWQLNSTIKNE